MYGEHECVEGFWGGGEACSDGEMMEEVTGVAGYLNSRKERTSGDELLIGGCTYVQWIAF